MQTTQMYRKEEDENNENGINIISYIQNVESAKVYTNQKKKNTYHPKYKIHECMMDEMSVLVLMMIMNEVIY